jgi:hypothetical protein
MRFFGESDEPSSDSYLVAEELFNPPQRTVRVASADQTYPSVHRTLDELKLVHPALSLSLTVGPDHRRCHRFYVLKELRRKRFDLRYLRLSCLRHPPLQQPSGSVMSIRFSVVVTSTEQPGEFLKQVAALPYVAVDHLHALKGQRFLLRTSLRTPDEDPFCLGGAKTGRRADSFRVEISGSSLPTTYRPQALWKLLVRCI